MTKKIFIIVSVFVVLFTTTFSAFAASAPAPADLYYSYFDFVLEAEADGAAYAVNLTDPVFSGQVDSECTYGSVTFDKFNYDISPPTASDEPGHCSYAITAPLDLDDFTVRSNHFVIDTSYMSVPSITLPAGWDGTVEISYLRKATASVSEEFDEYQYTVTVIGGGVVPLLDASELVYQTQDGDYKLEVLAYQAVFTSLSLSEISTYSSSVYGKWIFNEHLNLITGIGVTPVQFISNGTIYQAMQVLSFKNVYRLTANSSTGQVEVYVGQQWISDEYRTVDFGTDPQTVSDEFYAWFVNNATPVDPDPQLNLTINYDINTAYGVWYNDLLFTTYHDIYVKDYGYSLGMQFDEVDYTSWLGAAVGGFFDAEILPGIYLGGIVAVLIAIALVLLFLKFFAGG